MTDFNAISQEELNKIFIEKKLNIDCRCENENIYIDIHNKRIECAKCGAILDPFDVVYRLFYQEDRYMERIKFLRQECEELEKWLLNNRMGSALRDIAKNIRQKEVPACPHCGYGIDITNLKSWMSYDYAIQKNKLMDEQKEKQNDGNRC